MGAWRKRRTIRAACAKCIILFSVKLTGNSVDAVSTCLFSRTPKGHAPNRTAVIATKVRFARISYRSVPSGSRTAPAAEPVRRPRAPSPAASRMSPLAPAVPPPGSARACAAARADDRQLRSPGARGRSRASGAAPTRRRWQPARYVGARPVRAAFRLRRVSAGGPGRRLQGTALAAMKPMPPAHPSTVPPRVQAQAAAGAPAATGCPAPPSR